MLIIGLENIKTASVEELQKMVKAAADLPAFNYVTLDEKAIREVLSQAGAVNARQYSIAIELEGALLTSSIFIGVDSKGEDLVGDKDLAYISAKPCPIFCGGGKLD
jgi:hypothetical protein